MNKYRIVERHYGERCWFEVQKKCLFLWITITKTIDAEGTFDIGPIDIIIEFSSKQEAEKYIENRLLTTSTTIHPKIYS